MRTFSSPGGFIVMPNTIDFSNLNFNPMDNPTIYTFVGILLFLYASFMVWARWRGKKDVEKLGVAPLPDNNPKHKYFYEIVVVTGVQVNQKQKSKQKTKDKAKDKTTF
jgi:hypothetical protein